MRLPALPHLPAVRSAARGSLRASVRVCCVLTTLAALAPSLPAQNPVSAVYPSAIADSEDLPLPVNRFSASLTSSISDSTLLIPVSDAAGLIFPTIVTINSESIKVCSESPADTLVVCTGGRGLLSTAAAHSEDDAVEVLVDEYFQLAATAEIIAIQTALGASLANVLAPGAVDISDDTNLAADGQGIELTGDTLSLELNGATLAKSASGLLVSTVAGVTGADSDDLSDDNLSALASSTSAQLLALLSDETGTGAAVFATSPTLTTPTIASFVNATHVHQAAASGGTLDHGLALTGLADDDHTQYALLAGRSSGQILIGGIGAGDDLTLQTTSNAAKGSYILSELVSCDTIDTDSSGVLTCGSDAGSGSARSWSKVTIDTSDLNDADTSEDETLASVSQYQKVCGVVIKHSTAFSGGTTTALTVSVGSSASPASYASAFDIFQAAGDTIYQDSLVFRSLTMAAAGHNAIARFTSAGDNLDQLSAGSVDIWVCREAVQ